MAARTPTLRRSLLWTASLALVLVPTGALATGLQEQLLANPLPVPGLTLARPNAAPHVIFTRPYANASLPADRFDAARGMWYADVRVATFAWDREDGILALGSVAIYDRMNGGPWRFLGWGFVEHARLHVDCSQGEAARHDLLAVVRDSGGRVARARTTVFATTLC